VFTSIWRTFPINILEFFFINERPLVCFLPLRIQSIVAMTNKGRTHFPVKLALSSDIPTVSDNRSTCFYALLNTWTWRYWPASVPLFHYSFIFIWILYLWSNIHFKKRQNKNCVVWKLNPVSCRPIFGCEL